MPIPSRTCYVCDVSVTESWVEGVADGTQPHDAIPGLQSVEHTRTTNTHVCLSVVCYYACRTRQVDMR
jgi:hypothetical protein